MRRTVGLLILVLSSCATMFPTVVPEALSAEYTPTGEVLAYSRTASFDAVRVRSPHCNLAKRTDGSWGGTLGERPLDVSVTETHVRGVEFILNREIEGNKTTITGQFQGRIYRFELDDQQVVIRGPNTSMTYPGRQTTPQGVVYGPMGNLQMKGEAGTDNPPWPQIGFALMALMQ